MLRRLVLLSVVVVGLTGCKGGGAEPMALSVDDLVATPMAGATIKRIVKDDKVVLDLLDPEGIEEGVTNAAHVITSEYLLYTLYDYKDESAASAAMELWRKGNLGAPQLGIRETAKDMLTIPGAVTLLGTKGTTRVVAPVGNRLIVVIGRDPEAVDNLAVLLTKQLGGGTTAP